MAASVLNYNSSGDEELETEKDGDEHHWPVSLLSAMDGATPVKLPGDATDGLVVQVSVLPADTTAAAVTAAHGAADAGHPVKVGGFASDEEPAAVAADDRVNKWSDLHGRDVVTRAPRAMVDQQRTTITETMTETIMMAAGAAGLTRDICKLRMSNRHATIPVQVEIRDAEGGTLRDTITLAPLGSCDLNFDPTWNQAAAATAWTAKLSVNTVIVDISVFSIETGVAS